MKTPLPHNVHLLARIDRPVETIPTALTDCNPRILSRSELAIPVGLYDVHPWMRAYLVFDNPYYAINSRNGSFELRIFRRAPTRRSLARNDYGTQDQIVIIVPKNRSPFRYIQIRRILAGADSHAAKQ